MAEMCGAEAMDRRTNQVSISGLMLLGLSTAIFLAAATAAKSWALAPGTGKILLTLLLYSTGNLIMLKLIRDFGMSVSFSLSAVIQLVAVNVVALAFFGERLTTLQTIGIGFAVLSVALITLGPSIGSGK
jgi:drug/metabolite transporter (DMT)-like permease